MMDTTKRRRGRAALLAGAAAAGLLALPAEPASAITTTIPVTSRISTATGGGQLVEGQFDDPRLDATGRFVFFSTDAAVVAADTNGEPDVYRKDRLTGRTELVGLLGEDTLLADGTRFDEPTFKAWVEAGEGRALPGALELLRLAADRGVEIFYVSNRDADEEPGTRRNLVREGFPVPEERPAAGR